MNRLSVFLLGIGTIAAGIILSFISFYLVFLLLPIILIIIFFTAGINILGTIFKQQQSAKRKKIDIHVRKTPTSGGEIIDAEYEILDDGKKK